MSIGTGRSVSNVYDLPGRMTVSNLNAPKECRFIHSPNGALLAVAALNVPDRNRTCTCDTASRLTRGIALHERDIDDA